MGEKLKTKDYQQLLLSLEPPNKKTRMGPKKKVEIKIEKKPEQM